jgi:hypothetical protein
MEVFVHLFKKLKSFEPYHTTPINLTKQADFQFLKVICPGGRLPSSIVLSSTGLDVPMTGGWIKQN